MNNIFARRNITTKCSLKWNCKIDRDEWLCRKLLTRGRTKSLFKAWIYKKLKRLLRINWKPVGDVLSGKSWSYFFWCLISHVWSIIWSLSLFTEGIYNLCLALMKTRKLRKHTNMVMSLNKYIPIVQMVSLHKFSKVSKNNIPILFISVNFLQYSWSTNKSFEILRQFKPYCDSKILFCEHLFYNKVILPTFYPHSVEADLSRKRKNVCF